MTKLKNCKSCNQEVAKGAKACPHCGQKLKMGIFPKFLIGIVLLIGVIVVSLPSSEDIAKQIAEVEQATPVDVAPTGPLADLFSPLGENTDIQRDNMEKELTGKVVQWTLPVYDVNVTNEDKRIYRIQTSAKNNTVGAFINLHARDDAEVKLIEGLIEDSLISIKGKITGTFLRSIEIDQARLMQQ